MQNITSDISKIYKELLQLNKLNLKMDKIFQETLHQVRYTHDRHTCEKIFGIICHWEFQMKHIPISMTKI